MTITKESIILSIKDYVSTHNKNPGMRDLPMSYETIRRRFGSLGQAIIASGFSYSAPKNTPKVCANCGTHYKAYENARKFCSLSCSASYNNTGRVVADHTNIKKRDTRWKNTPPYCKIFYYNCSECNTTFITGKRGKRTCSVTCQHTVSSKTALSNPKFGGNCSRNIIEYKSPNTNLTYKFDSSWEHKLAVLLDQERIEWTRPTEPVKYLSETKTRRYFPDFFLPTYNVYIDTKNPWRVKEDMNKLMLVTQQNQIALVIIQSVLAIQQYTPTSLSCGLYFI